MDPANDQSAPGNTSRSRWGYRFEMTPEHWNQQQMDSMKHSFDELGESSYIKLDALKGSWSSRVPRTGPKMPASNDKGKWEEQDLVTILKKNHVTDPVLRKLWDEIQTVPPWVSWAQVGRGQDVFYRYGGPALTGLCFQSLLGGLVRHSVPSGLNESLSGRYRAQTGWLRFWPGLSVYSFSFADIESKSSLSLVCPDSMWSLNVQKA